MPRPVGQIIGGGTIIKWLMHFIPDQVYHVEPWLVRVIVDLPQVNLCLTLCLFIFFEGSKRAILAHCEVSLDRTLNFHSTSLHLGVKFNKMFTPHLVNLMLRVFPALDLHTNLRVDINCGAASVGVTR